MPKLIDRSHTFLFGIREVKKPFSRAFHLTAIRFVFVGVGGVSSSFFLYPSSAHHQKNTHEKSFSIDGLSRSRDI